MADDDAEPPAAAAAAAGEPDAVRANAVAGDKPAAPGAAAMVPAPLTGVAAHASVGERPWDATVGVAIADRASSAASTASGTRARGVIASPWTPPPRDAAPSRLRVRGDITTAAPLLNGLAAAAAARSSATPAPSDTDRCRPVGCSCNAARRPGDRGDARRPGDSGMEGGTDMSTSSAAGALAAALLPGAAIVSRCGAGKPTAAAVASSRPNADGDRRMCDPPSPPLSPPALAAAGDRRRCCC